MKTFLTLIFSMLLIDGFAQVWIDSGAKWTFDYFNVSETGTYRWEYTRDTVILGHPSQVIKATVYRYGGPGTATIDAGNVYTYHSNDSVFYFKDGRFFLLYDFGAQPGDTWVVAVDTSINACQDTAIVQVTDTGNMIINGQSFRTITLQTITTSLYALNGICVEKFGILPTSWQNSNLGFLPGYRLCPDGPVIDYPMLTFRCYEDADFPTYNPTGKDCDTLTAVSEQTFGKFSIYPNPADQILHIDAPEHTIVRIEITGLRGRTLLSEPYRGTIDISRLKPGMYFLRMITDDHKVALRKFIRE